MAEEEMGVGEEEEGMEEDITPALPHSRIRDQTRTRIKRRTLRMPVRSRGGVSRVEEGEGGSIG